MNQIKKLSHLLSEIKNQNQLWLTLNSPENMNAISYEMIDALTSELYAADANPQIKVIVITGAGAAFSAGGDIKAMHEKTGMFAGEANELRLRYMQGIQRIPKCIEDVSKPIIAMVNGPAIGAGCDLAMMCDLRVGSEKSKFGETFAKLALIPGDGGSFFLTRIVGYAKALQMALTCEIIEGQKAFDFGLMNYFYLSDHLEAQVFTLAKKISQLPQPALQMTKKLFKVAYLHDMQTNLDMAAAFQGIAQRTIDHEQAVRDFIINSAAKSK